MIAILSLCGGDLGICIALLADPQLPMPALRQWTPNALGARMITFFRLVELYGNTLIRTTIATACVERTMATLLLNYEHKPMAWCGALLLVLTVNYLLADVSSSPPVRDRRKIKG